MRVALSVLLVLLLVPGWSGEPRLPLVTGTPAVHVARVPLAPGDPSVRRAGRLAYLGGLHFSSRDSAFGGYSAMHVAGTRFTLLSDGGLTFAFDLDARLRASRFAFGALPDGPGTGWKKSDRDSESLAVDPATGQLWVGFERANAIWRYAPGFARAERAAVPPAMRRWPDNGGAEAMVRLRSGRFLVLSEAAAAPGGGRRALAFAGDPTTAPRESFAFAYVPDGNFRPTDIAELPDGRLLILDRRAALASRFTAMLSVVDPRAIRPGARVRGRPIATLGAPLIQDNFEALAITREGHATIVWLVSDDNNGFPTQRTLLLKFRLDDAPGGARRG